MKHSTRYLRWKYVVTDMLTTSAAWFCFNLWRYARPVGEDFPPVSLLEYYTWRPVMWGQIVFPLMMLGIYWLSGYYNDDVMRRSRIQELFTTLVSACTGAIAIFFLAIVNDMVPRRLIAAENLIIVAALLFVWVYVGRLLITRTQVKRTHRHAEFYPALMAGTDASARSLARRINNLPKGMGLQVADSVEATPARVMQECLAHDYRHVIVSPDVADTPALYDLLKALLPLDVSLYISPGLRHFSMSGHRVGNVLGEPLVDICHPSIAPYVVNFKRLTDVLTSSLALLLLSPLMLAIAVAIKLDSPGSVFYRQERMGRHRHPFRILKFRSMVRDAEALSGPTTAAERDPRITRVGRVLRKYRLDELPQFWNVLRGEMSIVGPRPERRHFADRIVEREPLYYMLYQVRPGITSWGMVKYGYASTVDQMVERLRYDLLYMENISLSTDIKILLHTVSTVLSGRGK